MKVIANIADFRIGIQALRKLGKSIGFVPTMGALHQGHLSLIEQSKEHNDVTVCSVFVNPIQFNNQSDLDKYPRQLEQDYMLLESVGCDLVFAPLADEVYPSKDVLSMKFEPIENVLEGEFRPGHFSGVGVVVAKFFNIVQPDNAYFGQKDLQQVAIIKKLVADLNFPISIVVVPTLREKSGLAMSSRNQRLTSDEKEVAAHLYQIMLESKSRIIAGETLEEGVLQAKLSFNKVNGMELEYFEIVNSLTFERQTTLETCSEVSICAAAFVSGVRIIDNIYLKQKN